MEKRTQDHIKQKVFLTPVDRLVRYIILPIVFLVGAFGLIRYVLVGGEPG